jgi:tripartite-type tricarboxylate transporter receptor subunit TctC
MTFDPVATSLPLIKDGKLRALAIAGPKRVAALPDVPTMAESGYPDYRVSVWYGVAAPARIPDDVAQKISASLERGLNDDAFRALLQKVGFAPLRPRSAAGIREFIDADRARWARVIKALNISLD